MYIFHSFQGVIAGTYVSRKAEDEFRLTIDRVIGSFQPFYAPCNYRFELSLVYQTIFLEKSFL